MKNWKNQERQLVMPYQIKGTTPHTGEIKLKLTNPLHTSS